MANTTKDLVISQLAQPLGGEPAVPMGLDFHALSSAQVDRVLHWAKAYGYRAPKNANGSTARCFYAFLNRSPKTEVLYVVQGDYGYGDGWEDVTASLNYAEVLRDLLTYRKESPGVHRLIERRVKKES